MIIKLKLIDFILLDIDINECSKNEINICRRGKKL